MERVAERAAVTIPVVYRHFSNRGDLLLALLEEYWHDFDRRLQIAIKTSGTLETLIRAATKAYFDSVEERGPVFLSLLSERTTAVQFEERRRSRRQQLVRTWAEQFERHSGLETSIAEAISWMMNAAAIGAAEYWVSHPKMLRQTIEDLQTTLSLSFIRQLVGDGSRKARSG